jgi:hypothetical protein
MTEAKEAPNRLAGVLQAAQKVADSLVWNSSALGLRERFTLDIVSMREALRPNLEAMMAAGQIFRSLVPPPVFEDLLAVSAAMEQVMKPISEAMQPLLDAQARYTPLIAEIMRSQSAFGGIGEFIARNNASIARALENIQAVGLAAQLRCSSLDQVLYVGVTDHLREVGQAYKGLLDSQIARMADIRPAVAPHLVWRDITVPSVSVGSYTRSLRWEVRVEEDEPISLDQLDFEQGAGPQLDDLLADLDRRFVDVRRGSWQAIRSNNPESVRHAAVSHRELVRQVLALLVPEADGDAKERGSKIKGAVRHLLGGSETSADFAVALSIAVYSLYNYLSKATHTNYRHVQAVQAALIAGEGLLLFLLAHHDESPAR